MGSFSDVIKPSLARFEAKHPSLKVHWVDMPFQDADKKLVAAALAQRLPDVVNVNPDLARLLAEKALLSALPASSKFSSALQHSVSWHRLDATQTVPSLFAYPWYATSQLRMVNQALRSSFISMATESLTNTPPCLPQWRAFQGTSTTYWMTPTLSEGGTLLKQFWLMGFEPFVPLVLPQESHVGQVARPQEVWIPNLRHPQFLALLQAWHQTYHQGGVPTESINAYKQQSASAFLQGRSIVLPAGSSFLNVLQTNQPQMLAHLKVLPQWHPCLHPPVKVRKVTTAMLSSHTQETRYDFAPMVLAIPHATRYQKKYGQLHPHALALLEHFTHPEEQQALVASLPILPTSQDLLSRMAEGSWMPSPPEKASPTLRRLWQEASQQGAWQLTHTLTSYPNVVQQAWVHQQVDTMVQEALLQPNTKHFAALLRTTERRIRDKLQADLQRQASLE
jgi:putative chitobiose transport system substrate-binding protein